MENNRETIRINKYLSEAGYCSRREADRLIGEGRVTVNDRPAVPGEKIPTDALVYVDAKPVEKRQEKVLLLFYKPRGLVCSARKQGDAKTVAEYLHYPVRVYPAGRLDKDSEGLLILTNEGGLANDIMRARNRHEKEYFVTVDRPIDEDFLQGMGGGVPILDTVTRPCQVKKRGKNSFSIVLTQGLNRQIRRMCEYFGYQVTSLKRVRIMNLRVDGLRPGEYRPLTKEERKELEKGIYGGQYGKSEADGD